MQRLVSYNKYIFFGVLLFRLWYALYFLVYGNDTFSQQFAAEQFLAGHGITHPVLSTVSPDSLVFEPMAKWPLTLILIQAVLYRVIPDWIAVSQLLTIISVIVFLGTLYKTVDLLGFSNQSKLITWLIVLTNPLLFHEFGVADWMGLAAFAVAFYGFSLFISRSGRTIGWLMGVSFLFYLPAAFRYQYYPLVLIFPAAALYGSWRHKDKQSLKQSLLLCLFTVAFLFIQISSFHLYAGSVEKLFPEAQGWYWSNLLQADPFLLKAVFRADYFIFKFPDYSNLVRYILSAVSLAFFLVLAVLLAGNTRKSDKANNQPASLFLQRCMLFTAGFFFVFLAFLSVQNPPVAFGFMHLNFAGETRYYSPVMYLLMLLLVWLLQDNRGRFLWRGVAFFILGCNMLLWLRFLTNIPGLPAPVTKLRWATEDRKVVKQAVLQAIPVTTMPVVISWLPTEYIVLDRFTDPTYILKDYRQLFSSSLPDACHFVFAAEIKYLSQDQLQQLKEKGFMEVFRNGFYVVLLRKAAT